MVRPLQITHTPHDNDGQSRESPEVAKERERLIKVRFLFHKTLFIEIREKATKENDKKAQRGQTEKARAGDHARV